MASKLWIVSTGGCGSTVLINILKELGFEYGKGRTVNVTEFDGATKINSKLIWHYFRMEDLPNGWMRSPMTNGWQQKLYHDNITPELKEEMIREATIFPEVVKDPRFSITLPTWLRFAPRSLLPDNMIHLTRDVFQCAMTTVGMKPKKYEEALEAVKLRMMNTAIALSHVHARHIRVFSVVYPDCLLKPEPLVDAVTSIKPSITTDQVINAVKKLTNYDKIEKSLERVIPTDKEL